MTVEFESEGVESLGRNIVVSDGSKLAVLAEVGPETRVSMMVLSKFWRLPPLQGRESIASNNVLTSGVSITHHGYTVMGFGVRWSEMRWFTEVSRLLVRYEMNGLFYTSIFYQNE